MNRWFKLAGVTAGVTLGLGTLVAFSEATESTAPPETVTVVTVPDDIADATELAASVVTAARDTEVRTTETPASIPAPLQDIETPAETPVVETSAVTKLPADMDLGTLKCGESAKPAIDYHPDWGWWAYCEPALVD